MSSEILRLAQALPIPALHSFARLLAEAHRPMPRSRPVSTQPFGLRLAQIRRARGLTQAELAGKVGISRRMIAYYEVESDRPPAHVLDHLASVLRVSTDELLGRKTIKTEAPLSIRLWRRFRLVEKLPDADRKAIFRLIDGMLERHGLESRG